MESVHRHILHNGQLIDNDAHTASVGQVGLLNGWGVFSTIRVLDGVLFAWEMHWKRMCHDARLMRVPMPAQPDNLREPLEKLVEANGAENATLRVEPFVATRFVLLSARPGTGGPPYVVEAAFPFEGVDADEGLG